MFHCRVRPVELHLAAAFEAGSRLRASHSEKYCLCVARGLPADDEVGVAEMRMYFTFQMIVGTVSPSFGASSTLEPFSLAPQKRILHDWSPPFQCACPNRLSHPEGRYDELFPMTNNRHLLMISPWIPSG